MFDRISLGRITDTSFVERGVLDIPLSRPPDFLRGPALFFRARKQFGKRLIFRFYTPLKRQDCYSYIVPFNPKTPTQQSNRMLFRDAMAAWSALTDEDKLTWDVKAKGLSLFGRNLFVKQYMLDHQP